jgi:NAD(P)-dependent dehydrogenase (short-subunit alcohol dehydrogenase family)
MPKTVLITGANKGIGFETARALAARGFTVLIGARDIERGKQAEQALRAEGRDAVRFLHLDVTDASLIAAAAATIDSDYGHLDVLVNNAGITTRGGPPSQTDLDGLRAIMETNVLGVIAVTNAMLALLRRAPGARIVNVSSEIGSVTFMTDRSSPAWKMPASVSYPASKTALNMVTAMYAKELADTPVKVNAANPGYCATDLNGHTGLRSAADGAEVSVHLATLPDDGPTGTFWGFRRGHPDAVPYGELAW